MADNHSWLHNKSMIEDQSCLGVWFGTIFSLSLAIIGGNSIALVVFLRKTFRVKKSNYLLVNLTLADLLVGVLNVILTVKTCVSFANDVFESKTVERERRGNDLKLLELVEVITVFASVYTLCLISVERVLAVFWPFHHRLAKRWHYFTAIALVWILSSMAFPVFVFGLSMRTTEEKVRIFLFFYSLVTISLLTIFISYLSIWIKMKFFTKFRNCRTIQENSKLTKTLFIVTVVSLGTWLPRVIMDWVLIINNLAYSKQNITLNIMVTALLLSNSFMNVVVYSFRIPEFKREIRQIFCQCR